MRSLIVTAANETYMPLLRGLIASLYQWEPRPFSEFACFDVGLSPESRQWISQYAAHVLEPRADLTVADDGATEKSAARALTARPFLPSYFPGYDVFLWLDADVWVQQRFALDWYLEAAAGGHFAATPEVHESYRHRAGHIRWRMDRMEAYFGPEAAALVPSQPYFNAGVFALRVDAPHWQLWENAFRKGLEATAGELCCDQTALNHVLWTEQAPVTALPALCNWCCHLALPSFDIERRLFCEPVAPGDALGILHLTAHTKDLVFAVADSEPVRKINLRFPPGGEERW